MVNLRIADRTLLDNASHTLFGFISGGRSFLVEKKTKAKNSGDQERKSESGAIKEEGKVQN